MIANQRNRFGGKWGRSIAIFLLIAMIGMTSFVPRLPTFIFAILGSAALIATDPPGSRTLGIDLRWVGYTFAPMLVMGTTLGVSAASWLVFAGDQVDGVSIFRDLYYMVGCIAFFLFGSRLARRLSLQTVIYTLMITAAVISALYIIRYKSQIGGLAKVDHYSVRTDVGNGYFVSSVCCALLLTFWPIAKKGLIQAGLFTTCLSLSAASMYLSDSRSSMLLVAISILFLVFPANNRKMLMLAIVIIGFLAEFVITTPALDYLLHIKLSDDLVAILPEKMQEVVPVLYGRLDDINDHWRGYETAAAVRYALSDGVIKAVFGHGIGALSPLNVSIDLGFGPTNRIGQFHNGFSWLMVKGGVVATGIFFWQLIRLTSAIVPISTLRGRLGGLCASIIAYIAVMTSSTSGMLNPTNDITALSMVLLGMFGSMLWKAAKCSAHGKGAPNASRS